MVKLITLSDERMTISAANCIASAIMNGVDDVTIFAPEEFPDWFKNHHKELLKSERGYGFWCWKPYLVSMTINKMKDGDILIWADAGQTFVNDVNHVIKEMKEDVFLFSNGWPHFDWCKADCIDCIIPFPQEKDYKQTQASLIFFRVSEESRNFCKEWFAYSLIPGIIDNEPSKIDNVETFKEHRHDQAILCCLQIKHGYNLHWFPTTTAGHIHEDYPDRYPAIVDHHRKRNSEWA